MVLNKHVRNSMVLLSIPINSLINIEGLICNFNILEVEANLKTPLYAVWDFLYAFVFGNLHILSPSLSYKASSPPSCLVASIRR